MVDYNEFGLFAENAAEYGIEWSGPPTVRRESVALPSGLSLSSLVWGTAEPELVLIHGGAQNAHTWDTVALALGRPLVAVDLPGHGHSDHRPDHDYGPASMADDVAVAVEALAPRAEAVVGMSLGGLTAICLAADHPHLVRRLGIVDVTPGTDHKKAEPIIAFVDGPEHFDSLEAILKRTIEHNPTRSESSLRRGVLHNAHEMSDGRWDLELRPDAGLEDRRRGRAGVRGPVGEGLSHRGTGRAVAGRSLERGRRRRCGRVDAAAPGHRPCCGRGVPDTPSRAISPWSWSR